jgi:cytochrome c-type biogenesis protein
MNVSSLRWSGGSTKSSPGGTSARVAHLMEKAGGLFLLGFVSIAFPCVLPLVPGYLSAVSAVEAHRLGDRGVGLRVAVASIPFIAGFAAVFVLLGAAANLIASVMSEGTREALAGFILVVAGLAFMGLLPWTDRLVAGGLVHGARRSGSRVLLGGAFAICAAPCVGPFLAEAFAAASSSDTVLRGSAWLAAYSAGLGLAFLLVAVFFVRGMAFFRWLRDHYRVFSFAGGMILVALGLLLFFDEFYRVQVYTHRLLEALGLGDL